MPQTYSRVGQDLGLCSIPPSPSGWRRKWTLPLTAEQAKTVVSPLSLTLPHIEMLYAVTGAAVT